MLPCRSPRHMVRPPSFWAALLLGLVGDGSSYRAFYDPPLRRAPATSTGHAAQQEVGRNRPKDPTKVGAAAAMAQPIASRRERPNGWPNTNGLRARAHAWHLHSLNKTIVRDAMDTACSMHTIAAWAGVMTAHARHRQHAGLSGTIFDSIADKLKPTDFGSKPSLEGGGPPCEQQAAFAAV